MMDADALNARRTLSRLKRGVPPGAGVARIAVGMDRLQTRTRALLTDEPTPRWFAVAGEYGEGKSFFQSLASEIALESGYAVAVMDVNKDSGALHQPQKHFSLLLSSLRSPLPGFCCHHGLDEILRKWFDTAPRDEVVSVLSRMRSVNAWSNAGRDPDLFVACASDLVPQGVGRPSPHVTSAGRSNGDGEVYVDEFGTMYRRGLLSLAVYCRRAGSTMWQYSAPGEQWPLLKQRLFPAGQFGGTETNNDGYGHQSLLNMLSFLCGRDLFARSAAARFAAAYRLQLIQEWLLATGHRGLLVFIDELDNVVRQISARGHAACFRTLAMYCSCPTLQQVRVIFAATPEVIDMLDHGGRTSYLRELENQVTVRPEEVTIYRRWKKEADGLAQEGWERCVRLKSSQRLTLFERVADLHEQAWGLRVRCDERLVSDLARLPQFDTTRRWVRASVQLLDLLEQQQRKDYPEIPQEVWTLTLREWQEVRDRLSALSRGGDRLAEEQLREIGGMTTDYAHKWRVQQALKQGLRVPARVLTDYPDLQEPH